MDPQQGQQIFLQADALFRGGQPAEALALLQQLDRAHPNRLDILFPALLCLEKLGKTKEAIRLADRLVRDFKDPRARKVRARIAPTSPYAPPGLDIPGMNPVAAAEGMPGLNMNALAGLLDDDPPRRAGPPPLAQDEFGGRRSPRDILPRRHRERRVPRERVLRGHTPVE